MSNEAPATDWAADVKRYVPAADSGAIAGLVRHCLVSQKTREAPLVSFGMPAETRSVRENFCKKTLGLSDSDGALGRCADERYHLPPPGHGLLPARRTFRQAGAARRRSRGDATGPGGPDPGTVGGEHV